MNKKETTKKLEAAIVACANKATEACDANDALRFTQAALNAAHAIGRIATSEIPN